MQPAAAQKSEARSSSKSPVLHNLQAAQQLVVEDPPMASDLSRTSAAIGGSNSSLPELVIATKLLILREGYEPNSTISDSLNVHAGWVLRVLDIKELPDGQGQRVRVKLDMRETDEMERSVGEGTITPRAIIPPSARKRVMGWVDAVGGDGSPNLKAYTRTFAAPAAKAVVAASPSFSATVPVLSGPPQPEVGGLVTAVTSLILREGWEPDSTISDSYNIHAGWVMKVLEVMELPDGRGRVRVALARPETDGMERASRDTGSFISPRTANRGYSGWVDAIGSHGTNLKPYEKPSETATSSARGMSRSPRRSPRKKLTPEQVHAASGLPLSAGGRGARRGSLPPTLSRDRKSSKEMLEGTKTGPAVSKSDVTADTKAESAPAVAAIVTRKSTSEPSSLSKSSAPMSAAAKKGANSIWAAFSETLFKGDEAEDESKLRSVFNSIVRAPNAMATPLSIQ